MRPKSEVEKSYRKTIANKTKSSDLPARAVSNLIKSAVLGDPRTRRVQEIKEQMISLNSPLQMGKTVNNGDENPQYNVKTLNRFNFLKDDDEMDTEQSNTTQNNN